MTKTDTAFINSLLFADADAAGQAAAEAARPTPMVVRDEITGHVYEPIEAGVCGFAWVNVPGNSSFGRYLKQVHGCTKGYPSGISFWVRGYGQSLERKAAYAHAFAAVLREGSVQAVASSRMD